MLVKFLDEIGGEIEALNFAPFSRKAKTEFDRATALMKTRGYSEVDIEVDGVIVREGFLNHTRAIRNEQFPECF